jgi:hypothetical protein
LHIFSSSIGRVVLWILTTVLMKVHLVRLGLLAKVFLGGPSDLVIFRVGVALVVVQAIFLNVLVVLLTRVGVLVAVILIKVFLVVLVVQAIALLVLGIALSVPVINLVGAAVLWILITVLMKAIFLLGLSIRLIQSHLRSLANLSFLLLIRLLAQFGRHFRQISQPARRSFLF